MVLILGCAKGSPRIVVPVAVPSIVVRLFFKRTAEAEPISRTSAVCSEVRTFTSRLRGPEPSGFWESKFVGGYP